ncbi:MAG: hypothetical protein A2077_02315 [Nitrospirae bacterium GWC2_46_6]|nr:MAG: hypothetical protein A2077_02315 [Nitrospirae bacterium GWC2_46_6]
MLGFLTKINPLTYGIDALKYMIFPEKKLLTHDFPLSLDVAAIVISSIVFVIIAAMVFERRK